MSLESRMLASRLPQLDALYKSRTKKGEYNKLTKSDEKGVYLVAAQDIQRGDVVFIEKKLGSVTMDATFLQRPEVAPLTKILSDLNESHGHLTGVDRYPPEAKHVMDRLAELMAREQLSRSPRIKEIWQLHDAHYCAEKGDSVVIDGLLSEAGKKLNGKQGEVVGVDEKAPDRLAVMIPAAGPTEKAGQLSIKGVNLKTLGGIVRTKNAYEHDNMQGLHDSVLFPTLSRINHACGNSANVIQMINDDKAYVLTKNQIQKGEEILIDYLAGEDNDEDRLSLLQFKYNFKCRCGEH